MSCRNAYQTVLYEHITCDVRCIQKLYGLECSHQGRVHRVETIYPETIHQFVMLCGYASRLIFLYMSYD